MSKRNPAPSNVLLVLAMSLALILVSFVRIWGDAGSAAFDGKIIRATLSQPIWGTALAMNLALFVGALVLVHSLYGLGCLVLGYLSQRAWPDSKNTVRAWMLLWFILGTMWILIANATWYPQSSLGSPYAEWAQRSWMGQTPLTLFSTAIGILTTVTFIRLLATQPTRQYLMSPPVRTLVVAGVGMAAISMLAFSTDAEGEHTSTPMRPHVILIGLDSLRTDVAYGELLICT